MLTTMTFRSLIPFFSSSSCISKGSEVDQIRVVVSDFSVPGISIPITLSFFVNMDVMKRGVMLLT